MSPAGNALKNKIWGFKYKYSEEDMKEIIDILGRLRFGGIEWEDRMRLVGFLRKSEASEVVGSEVEILLSRFSRYYKMTWVELRAIEDDLKKMGVVEGDRGMILEILGCSDYLDYFECESGKLPEDKVVEELLMTQQLDSRDVRRIRKLCWPYKMTDGMVAELFKNLKLETLSKKKRESWVNWLYVLKDTSPSTFRDHVRRKERLHGSDPKIISMELEDKYAGIEHMSRMFENMWCMRPHRDYFLGSARWEKDTRFL